MQGSSPGERGAPAGGRLDEIRRDLTRSLLLPFVLVMGVATVEGFWPTAGLSQQLALAVLALAGIFLPLTMARSTRRIIARIRALDEERERLENLYGRARMDSLQDALSGLGNHRAFQDELARQLALAARHKAPLSLVLVDVDDLKKVNDLDGHASGDKLLAAVGRIATATLRRSDRAFRVGGDEFAILLPNTRSDTALAVARRLLASALGGGGPTQSIAPFSLSIGVSSYPSPSAVPENLYRDADAALYWCKRHGRTAVVVFDPGKHGGTDDRSVEDLSAAVGQMLTGQALTGQALHPVYQPIFSLDDGRPVGFEGLIRPAKDAPLPDPSSLFAAAEAAGRTVELDLLCLDIVARGAGTLEPGTYLSVNLSPRTLESDLFSPSELKAIFRRHGIPLDQVVLELTERQEVTDLDQLRQNVARCRRAGMRIAADDVGAGNAGLRLLSEIHFDIVKIDLSLVQGGILHDPSHAVLRALQELANHWHASVVAEGVETAEQLTVIRELGIGAGQGYLLGRPAPGRQAEVLDLDSLAAPVSLRELAS
jgi:diguanylate cyclase (GGDEF)-like protein